MRVNGKILGTLFLISKEFYNKYYKFIDINKDSNDNRDRISQAFSLYMIGLYIIGMLLWFQIRNIGDINLFFSTKTIMLIIIISAMCTLLSVYLASKITNRIFKITIYIISIFILIWIIILNY